MKTIFLYRRYDELHILEGQKLINILYGAAERQEIVNKLSPEERERLEAGDEIPLDNPLPV